MPGKLGGVISLSVMLIWMASLPCLGGSASGAGGSAPEASEWLRWRLLQPSAPSGGRMWARVLLDLELSKDEQGRAETVARIELEGPAEDETPDDWVARVESRLVALARRDRPGSEPYLPQRRFLAALARQMKKHPLCLHVSFDEGMKARGEMLLGSDLTEDEVRGELAKSLAGVEVVVADSRSGARISYGEYTLEARTIEKPSEVLGQVESGHLFVPAERIQNSVEHGLAHVRLAGAVCTSYVQYDPLSAARQLLVLKIPDPAAQSTECDPSSKPNPTPTSVYFVTGTERVVPVEPAPRSRSELLEVGVGWAWSTRETGGPLTVLSWPTRRPNLNWTCVATAPVMVTVELRTCPLASGVRYPYLYVAAQSKASPGDTDVRLRSSRWRYSLGAAWSDSAVTLGMAYQIPFSSKYSISLHGGAISPGRRDAWGTMWAVSLNVQELEKLMGMVIKH